MRLLNRLLPMLALIGALSVLGLALAWLIHADAPMPGEVRVLVNAGQDGASDTRLIARPGAEPTLNASLDFDMPASRQGPWVLWLPREPLQSILVTGKDAQGRPWTSAPDGFFTPSPSDGFAPAG
ncbi:MAG TPA: hypothetical protein PK861_12995, partial [Thermomonas sp.]|nr:hypothetical protein [Thermomonas sp.]